MRPLPEWGRPIWVHLDSGSKLDGRAAEARWMGFDGDSTHAHRIYWQDKNRVSVERNVRFTSNIVTIRLPLPSDTITANNHIINVSPNATCQSSYNLKFKYYYYKHKYYSTAATDTGEEDAGRRRSSRRRATQNSRSNNRAITAKRIQEASSSTRTTGTATQATRKSTRKPNLHEKPGHSSCKTKQRNAKAEEKDNHQWPDDGVFRGIHPDYKGSPTATHTPCYDREFPTTPLTYSSC
jgi:hypothetical protein